MHSGRRILAIDTSTGTSVALVDDSGEVIAERGDATPLQHVERIGPFLEECLVAGGGRVDAVAVGIGPGPFTGLRVGIAAAQAFAEGRGVPLWPVASHDGAIELITEEGPVAIVTDARRRERAVTEYDANRERVSETTLQPTEAVATRGTRIDVALVSAVGIARRALAVERAGAEHPNPEAIYLRAPDAVPNAPRKRVS